MPGIAGVLAKHKCSTTGSQLIEAMLQSMMLEPFYTKETHVHEAHGWFTGRVAIEKTFADRTPAFNSKRTIALLMSGECVLKDEDGAFGKNFGPNDVISMYESEGLNFIEKLDGLFSGILLDSQTERAVLFTDRCGLRRVYYHETADALYFASEAKALLAALPALRDVDDQSLAEYLSFDCVLEERTYFRRVSVLKAGSLLICDRGKIDVRPYFDPVELESQPELEPKKFAECLAAAFDQAVRRQLGKDDDHIAIALTGGLDTRFIVSCLPRECERVSTLTFSGMYRDSVDLRRARDVSRACNLTHHTVPLDQRFLENYGSHAAKAIYASDGLADVTSVDNLYLNNCARRIAPIKITGAFGSQVLGRVKRALRYRPPTPELLDPDFRVHVVAASQTLKEWEREHDLSYCLKRETPWYWSRFIASEFSQLTLRLPFLDASLISLLYQAPRNFDGEKFELAAIARNRPELATIRTNKGAAAGASHTATSALIQKFVRGRALAEKCLVWDVLPHSLQHVASRLDHHILSPLHLDRLIYGWEYFRHYNRWFRRELASYLKDVVLDSRTLQRPYWNRNYLEKMVDDHVRGRRNNLSDIRKVLTIELMVRELIEAQRTPALHIDSPHRGAAAA